MAHEHSHEGHGHPHAGHSAEEQDDEGYAEMMANFEKAGEICRKAKEHALASAKPGTKLLGLAEGIEAKINELGGKPAFPVNLSANNRAAHYTPTADDAAVIGDYDVMKIDFGVHIDGCVVDNSVTVDFSGEHGKLVDAAKEALANALGMMKAGVSTEAVGREIEQTIRKHGFAPVENLCGHLIMPWQLHAGVEVPNVGSHGGVPLEEGMVYAVEPFVSTGVGRVKDDPSFCEIYSLSEVKPVRLPASRKLLELVAEEYQTLPFAKRWLQEVPMLQMALSDLQRQGLLQGYNLLQEAPGTLVSQAETSVVIEEDGVHILV